MTIRPATGHLLTEKVGDSLGGMLCLGAVLRIRKEERKQLPRAAIHSHLPVAKRVVPIYQLSPLERVAWESQAEQGTRSTMTVSRPEGYVCGGVDTLAMNRAMGHRDMSAIMGQ